MHVLLEITPEIIDNQPPCPIAVAWEKATNTDCIVDKNVIVTLNGVYKMSKRLQEWLKGYYNNPSEAKPVTVDVSLINKTAVI